MAPGDNNLHWISTLGDINFIAYLLIGSTHLLMESTTWKIHYLVIESPLKLSLKAIWWKWVHGIKISTNSEVKKYFQDKIVKKYDILYDFWPKSMIVWHLGQKYDVRRNVWRLAALLSCLRAEILGGVPVGLVDLAVSLVDLAVGLVDRVGTGALDVLAKSGGPSLINSKVIAIFVKCAKVCKFVTQQEQEQEQEQQQEQQHKPQFYSFRLRSDNLYYSFTFRIL